MIINRYKYVWHVRVTSARTDPKDFINLEIFLNCSISCAYLSNEGDYSRATEIVIMTDDEAVALQIEGYLQSGKIRKVDNK